MLSVGSVILYFVFFFFQAEDGIRDWSVTGVQTCALPISCRRRGGSARPFVAQPPRRRQAQRSRGMRRRSSQRCGRRSEERRVGKECRSGWGPDRQRKKRDGENERRAAAYGGG